jgi:type 1 fimbriae regulatory protein FimB
MTTTKRRSVKGGAGEAVDAHERGKGYLSPGEVEKLLKAAKDGRHGDRDHALLLLMYRHGLRVSEAINIKLSHVNLDIPHIWVQRLKGSLSTEQRIQGDDLRVLRRYLRTRTDELEWLFISEQKTKLTRQAVNYIIRQAGERAGLDRVNPHMLRHSCGYALANMGKDTRLIQDYLGHRDPRHTVRYTQTSAKRFASIWDKKPGGPQT